MKVPIYAVEFPWSIIKSYSKIYNVEIEIIAAIIQAESSGNPWAIRYEPKFKWTHPTHNLAKRWNVSDDTALIVQKFSYGLMQIMGGTYLDLLGYDIPTCLFDCETNIKYGTLLIKNMLDKYNNHVIDAYAAYNAGSVKMEGKEYQNQLAVTRFKDIYMQFKGDKKVTTKEIGV